MIAAHVELAGRGALRRTPPCIIPGQTGLHIVRTTEFPHAHGKQSSVGVSRIVSQRGRLRKTACRGGRGEKPIAAGPNDPHPQSFSLCAGRREPAPGAGHGHRAPLPSQWAGCPLGGGWGEGLLPRDRLFDASHRTARCPGGEDMATRECGVVVGRYRRSGGSGYGQLASAFPRGIVLRRCRGHDRAGRCAAAKTRCERRVIPRGKCLDFPRTGVPSVPSRMNCGAGGEAVG